MIQFKNNKAKETFPQCDLRLIKAVEWCEQWFEERRLNFVITRAIDEMIPNVSKTDIHASGRAVDVSVHGMAADDIDDFIHDSNERFALEIGAISLTDKKPRFCVYHLGVGYHLHLQTRPL
jgi:hypothetical protein